MESSLDDWLLLARTALAATLALASVAKFSDRPAFEASLHSFGVPWPWGASVLALLVPVVEGAVSVLLLPHATARLGAAAATALLAVFTGVVAVSLLRGSRPSCRCFGPLSGDAVGADTLLRNLGLAAVAVWLLSKGPGPGPLVWWNTLPPGGRRIAALALPGLALVVALALTLGRTRRRLGDVERRLARMERMQGPADGLPVGAPAPRFTLPTLAGGSATLEELLPGSGHATLVFLTPGCDHCDELKTDLVAWQDRLDLIVVTKREGATAAGLRPDRIVLQEAWEVGERYRCEGVPSAVVVGPGPWVASLPVSGSGAVRALLTELDLQGQVPDWALRDEG